MLSEISSAIDLVVYNLDVLNRSLNDSVQVGKEFDDVGRLWSTFYNGIGKTRRQRSPRQRTRKLRQKMKHNQSTFVHIEASIQAPIALDSGNLEEPFVIRRDLLFAHTCH